MKDEPAPPKEKDAGEAGAICFEQAEDIDERKTRRGKKRKRHTRNGALKRRLT